MSDREMTNIPYKGVHVNWVDEDDAERLTYLKKCLTELASRTLDTAAYLRVKKDIAQCSGVDKLEVIGVSLIKMICV